MLAFQHVDLEIVAAGVLADDHAAIDPDAGSDQHRPAILKIPNRIGHGRALAIGDQRAGAPAGDIALVGDIGVEQPVHHTGSSSVGQEVPVIADQAAGRDVHDDAQLAAAGRTHVDQRTLAFRQRLKDRAAVVFIDVDLDLLDGLDGPAGFRVYLHHHTRPADRQFEALAAHGLDQDAELQFAAAGDLEAVLRRPVLDLERDIAFRLPEQPVADHPAGHLVAFGAGQR